MSNVAVALKRELPTECNACASSWFVLLQFPKFIWVDDPELSAANLESSASGVNFAIRVLMDSTHAIRRYTRACNESHPMFGECTTIVLSWRFES